LALLMAAPAFAADLSPAPQYAAPPLALWTGFNARLNAGRAIGNAGSDFSVAGATFASVNNSLTAAVAGGQLGYNWQAGPMVYGLEADIQYGAASGTLSAPRAAGLCGLALTANYSQEMAPCAAVSAMRRAAGSSTPRGATPTAS
jgi:outer membrane immunogenic protein